MMVHAHQLEVDVRSGLIDTVVVASIDHFGRLVGRRFDAHLVHEQTLGHSAHGCDHRLPVDMAMQPGAVVACATDAA